MSSNDDMAGILATMKPPTVDNIPPAAGAAQADNATGNPMMEMVNNALNGRTAADMDATRELWVVPKVGSDGQPVVMPEELLKAGVRPLDRINEPFYGTFQRGREAGMAEAMDNAIREASRAAEEGMDAGKLVKPGDTTGRMSSGDFCRIIMDYACDPLFQDRVKGVWSKGLLNPADKQFFPVWGATAYEEGLELVWDTLDGMVQAGSRAINSLDLTTAVSRSYSWGRLKDDENVRAILENLDDYARRDRSTDDRIKLLNTFLMERRLPQLIQQADKQGKPPYFTSMTMPERLDLAAWIRSEITISPDGWTDPFEIIPAGKLMSVYKEESPYLINPLLREEEVGLIAAPSKKGKSFLEMMMSLEVAFGRDVFGRFKTQKGGARVLIIDNELNRTTLGPRMSKMCEMMGLDKAEADKRVSIMSLNGVHVDINMLAVKLKSLVKPGEYKLLVLDSLYGFYPDKMDENACGDMSRVGGVIKEICKYLKCACLVIHHVPKGDMSGRSTIDAPAGSGAMSRLADNIVAFKDHVRPGGAVMSASLRTSASPDDLCLEFLFPLWQARPAWDPTALRTGNKTKDAKKLAELTPEQGGVQNGAPKPPAETKYTDEEFVQMFVSSKPLNVEEIVTMAVDDGMSDTKARKMLKRVVTKGLVFKGTLPPDTRMSFYATTSPESWQNSDPGNSQA